VIPLVGGKTSDDPFVVIAAAMQTIMEEMMTRSVGALVAEALSSGSSKTVSNSTGDGDDEEHEEGSDEPSTKKRRAISDNIPITTEGTPDVSFKASKMRTTLTKEDLNIAIHFQTTPDMIKRYSTNQIYAHRRTSYEKELEKEETKNSTRNKTMKRKKRVMKKVALERAKNINEKGLLLSEEIVSYMVNDNTLALIFKDTKLLDTTTIMNIREDVLPTQVKKRAKQYAEGAGVSLPPHETLRMLQFMWEEFAATDDASKWRASERV